MSLTTQGINLLIEDTVSKEAVDVYSVQCGLDLVFNHDYCDAYAYGDKNAAQRVHERVAAVGADQLGIAVETYLDLWKQAVEAIMNYWDIPEDFRDKERYET